MKRIVQSTTNILNNTAKYTTATTKKVVRGTVDAVKSTTTAVKTSATDFGERWSSESPTFWKKVLRFSVTLGLFSGGVLTSAKLFPLIDDFGMPKIVFTIAGYVFTFCTALGFAAKITKKE